MPEITLALACLVPTIVSAQTLPARPVPLEEPVQGGTWKDGELVLGKTTLAGARRMLAAAAGAADTHRVPEERAWEVGGVTLRPRWEFDPGEEFFQLFFDENERLIYALDRRAQPSLSRLEFLSHYPRALREQQSGSFDQYQVDVQPCVTVTALVDRGTDKITQYGYAWTCRTTALAPLGGHGNAGGR
jgi:hypothetical protein